MGEDARTNGTPALTLAEGDPVALRAQIETTRAELGDTVAALAIKADVKAQARDRIALAKQSARTRAAAIQLRAKRNPTAFAAGGAAAAGLVVLLIARVPLTEDKRRGWLERRRSGGLIGRLRGRPARRPQNRRLRLHGPSEQATASLRRTVIQSTGTSAPPVTGKASRSSRPEDEHRAVTEGPTDISRAAGSRRSSATGKGFKADGLQDWAAALTYYSVLSLFPLLIVLVALSACSASTPAPSTRCSTSCARSRPAPPPTRCESSITGVVRDKGGAGALLGVGLVTALWSASGYIGAFMRAANAVYDVEEGRPFWKLRPLQLAVTTR